MRARLAAPAPGARDGCFRGRGGGTRDTCPLARLADGSRRCRGVVRGRQRRAGRTTLAASGSDERPSAGSHRGRVGRTVERPNCSRRVPDCDVGVVPRAGLIRGSVRRLGAPAGARAAACALAAPLAPDRGRRASLSRRLRRTSGTPPEQGAAVWVRLREVYLECDRAARRDAAENRVALLPRADEHGEKVLTLAPGGEATLT